MCVVNGGGTAAFSNIFPWASPPGQASFEISLLSSRVHARQTATNANR